MKALLISIIVWIRNFVKEKLNSKNEHLPYYITIVVALVLFILALNIFVELTDELAENELGPFDDAVTEYVISFRQDSLTRFFEFMTHVGDRYAYIVISVALGAYFFIRHKSLKFIAQTVLVLMLSTFSNVVIKKFVNRARPTLEHLVTVNTLSYPSGHSMSAMAFYGFLIYLTFQVKMPRIIRAMLIPLLIFIILCVGISRIYLGVHFPSDVAAGFMGGLIWVAFCVIVFNVIDLLRKQKI
jgi:undecaprenyl-diphosphatase